MIEFFLIFFPLYYRYLHETMECIENVAFALCGEDARTYYRELNVRVLAPTTDHLRCSERNCTYESEIVSLEQ